MERLPPPHSPHDRPRVPCSARGPRQEGLVDPAFLDGAPARYALSWEKVYLEGDLRYRKFLLEKGPRAADFRTNLE